MQSGEQNVPTGRRNGHSALSTATNAAYRGRFSVAIRPGFAVDQVEIPGEWDAVRSTYSPSRSFSVSHTAASILFSNDYKLNRRIALRSSFGAMVVRYRSLERDPEYIGKIPYLSFISTANFTNRTTWNWQGGPVVHF